MCVCNKINYMRNLVYLILKEMTKFCSRDKHSKFFQILNICKLTALAIFTLLFCTLIAFNTSMNETIARNCKINLKY